MKIIELNTKSEMLKAYELLLELYPDLVYKDFENQLDVMMPNNYSMIAICDNNNIIALAGIWIGNKLWCGKYLELDHVVVSEGSRSRGLGTKLINYAKSMAKKLDCSSLGLDSFTQNHASHKFFYREGFIAKGFHFVCEIDRKV